MTSPVRGRGVGAPVLGGRSALSDRRLEPVARAAVPDHGQRRRNGGDGRAAARVARETVGVHVSPPAAGRAEEVLHGSPIVLQPDALGRTGAGGRLEVGRCVLDASAGAVVEVSGHGLDVDQVGVLAVRGRGCGFDGGPGGQVDALGRSARRRGAGGGRDLSDGAGSGCGGPSAVAGTGVLAATVGECVAAEQPDRTAPGRKTRSSPGGMAAHRGQVVRGMSAPSRADPAAGDGPILA
jgi:hypothetical protein